MHQTWLAYLCLISLSSHVVAFYPYQERRDSADQKPLSIHEKRINSLRLREPQPALGPGSGLLKLDVHKVERRDNQFSKVLSNNPSAPHALAIHQDGSDYSYFSTMKFGSEAQEMFMLIDTGSANTWVFSSDCKSKTCSVHNTFGKEDSATLKTTSETWALAYGTGEVEGIVVKDKIAFANYSVDMGFGLATNASDDFNNYPMDGILGLGRKSSDQLGTPTIMDVLDDQADLTQNIIGVHLHRAKDGTKDGEIMFGGVDTSKFKGTLSYTETVNDDAWEIPVEDMLVNGSPAKFANRTAIIDTGTTFILIPPKDAKILHALIPDSQENGESYTLPCSARAKLEVRINGKLYEISPKDYVGKPVSSGSSTCSSTIIGHQAFGETQWILGDVFLKNVYAVFDFDEKRIGFALPGSGGKVTSSSTSSSSSSSSTSTASSSSSSTASASASSSQSASASSEPAASTGSSSSLNDSSLGGETQEGAAHQSGIGYWKIGLSISLALFAGAVIV